MKRKLFFPLLVLFASLVFTSCMKTGADYELDRRAYPGIEEMMDKFFKAVGKDPENFDGTNGEAQKYFSLSFAKKPDGWYLQKTDPFDEKNPGKMVAEEKIWGLGPKAFIKPGKSILKDAKFSRLDVIRSSMPHYYRRSLYYGYKGWDKDVIDALDGKSDLSDTLLESLGAACGSYGQSFLSPQYGFSAISDAERDKMKPEERIDNFCKYAEKEIACWKELLAKNPKYNTFVGSARTKYSNEIMNFYLQLAMNGKEERAKEYLKEPLYDDFYLNFARSTLNSCRKNGILFTNGDNDSFPLWYLQWIKGERKDVAVLNLSLLNLDYYVNYVKKIYNLQTTLKPEKYSGTVNEVVYINSSEDNPVVFTELLKRVNEGDPQLEYEYNGQKLPAFPSKYYTIDYDTEKALTGGNIDPSLKKLLSSSFNWKYKKNYFIRGDLMAADVICTNISERPCYFAITSGSPSENSSDCLGFGLNIAQVGMAYQIVPSEIKSDFVKAAPDEAYEWVMRKFKLGVSKDGGEDYERLTDNYRYAIYNMCSSLLELDSLSSKAHVKSMLDKCMTEIPKGKRPMDETASGLAWLYYKVGEKKSGSVIVGDCIDQFEEKLMENSKNKGKKDLYENERLKNYFENLRINCELYGDKENLDRLQAKCSGFMNSL